MKDKVKKYFSIPESRRVIYDYIRVLACIGIICLHATGDRSDLVGIFFETTSRIALPMFVLLSGVLVLGNPKTEDYLKFYGRRIVKIVIPYLIYGIIYIGWVYEGNNIPGSITWDRIHRLVTQIPRAIVVSMEEPPYFHLWFMMMIMGFYIVAPFYQRGLQGLKDKDLKWLYIVMLAVYTMSDYVPLIGIRIGINGFFPNWSIYFIAGYILYRFDNKRAHRFFAIIGAVSVVFMFLWKMRHPDIVIANFYDLAPHMLLATCGVFSMAMLLEPYITKLKWLNWIFMKISNYTFSIYMIHGFILISYVNSHESAAQTVKGTITEVLFVFFKCLIFVVIFDNLITFNIQRLIYFVTDKVSKLVKRLPFAKRQES